jgi:hypothetical protein
MRTHRVGKESDAAAQFAPREMAHFGVAFTDLGERDLGVFLVLCGAAGVVSRGSRVEDVFSEIEVCAVEPVRDAVHG